MALSSTLPANLVAPGSLPTSPEQVWAPAGLLRADWSEPVSLATTFRTGITASRTMSEQRFADMVKPRRTISFLNKALSQEDMSRLHQMLLRSSTSRLLVPIWCDGIFFQAGIGYTLIQYGEDNDLVRHWPLNVWLYGETSGWDSAVGRGTHYARLASRVNSSGNTLMTLEDKDAGGGGDTGLPNTWVKTSDGTHHRFWPCLECEPSLDSAAQMRSGWVGEARMEFVQTSRETSLDPIAAAGSIPAGLTTLDGYPVFPFKGRQGIQILSRSNAIVEDLGLGRISYRRGSQPRMVFSLGLQVIDRAEAWNLRKFFECRAGALHPFWLPGPESSVSFGGVIVANNIWLTANDDHALYEKYKKYVFVEKYDGTIVKGQISAALPQPGNRIRYDVVGTPFTGISASDVKRAGFLYLVRFSSDEMTEQWVTDGYMTTNLEMTELLEEKSVSITVPDVRQGGSPGPWIPPVDENNTNWVSDFYEIVFILDASESMDASMFSLAKSIINAIADKMRDPERPDWSKYALGLIEIRNANSTILSIIGDSTTTRNVDNFKSLVSGRPTPAGETLYSPAIQKASDQLAANDLAVPVESGRSHVIVVGDGLTTELNITAGIIDEMQSRSQVLDFIFIESSPTSKFDADIEATGGHWIAYDHGAAPAAVVVTSSGGHTPGAGIEDIYKVILPRLPSADPTV